MMRLLTLFSGTCFLSLALLAPLTAQAKTKKVPKVVQKAIKEGISIKDSKVEYRTYRAKKPAGCRIRHAQVDRPIQRSGRVLVKTTGLHKNGISCQGWAWVSIKLKVRMWVVTRSIDNGDLLKGRVTRKWRELKNGRVPFQGSITNLVANRFLPKASPIRSADIRAQGPQPGSNITVVVTAQALQIKQKGRVVPCNGTQPCAVLPSGKKVRGSYENQTLYVEVQ
jgi:hypothetical protein